MKRETIWQMRVSLGILLVSVILAVCCGCGASANGEGSVGSPRVLSSAEAKRLLLHLPYRYQWRRVPLPEGASAALAGTAVGNHRTILHFGIAFGTEAKPVPVPQAGARDPYDYTQGGGFSFTDDLVIPGGVGKQFHASAQWDEATTMEVEMEEKLCKASTGEFCPP
jgi:hypothetical protein